MVAESPRRIRRRRPLIPVRSWLPGAPDGRPRFLLASAMLGLAGAGCVATRADLRVVESEQARVRSELEAMQELLVDLTIRVQGNEVGLDRKQREWSELRSQVDEMTGRVRDLDARLAAVGPVASTGPDGRIYEEASSAFAAAESLYSAAETAQAEQMWGWLADRWPAEVTGQVARVRQAELASARGDAVRAVDALLELLAKARDAQVIGPAYLTLADALHALGEQDAARRALGDLVRILPDGPFADAARRRLAEWAEAVVAVTGPADLDGTMPAR